MTPLLFFFDYADPLSRLMDARLSVWESGAAVALERIPFEIAPAGVPLIDPDAPGWRARWEEADSVGGEGGIVRPRVPFVPRSRKAMELAMFAAEHGAFDRVHRTLFEAHLSRSLDIGRVDVLVDLAAEAGLDWSETKAVLDVDRYASRVEASRERGIELGVTMAPTVVVGGRRLEGLVEMAALEAALDSA